MIFIDCDEKRLERVVDEMSHRVAFNEVEVAAVEFEIDVEKADGEGVARGEWRRLSPLSPAPFPPPPAL